MKRLLLLVVFVIVPQFVGAQALSLPSRTLVTDALAGVVACTGLKGPVYDAGVMIVDEKILSAITIKNCKQPQEVKAAIDNILPGFYSAYLDLAGTLHIRVAAAQTATTNPAPQPYPPPPPPLPYPTIPPYVGTYYPGGLSPNEAALARIANAHTMAEANASLAELSLYLNQQSYYTPYGYGRAGYYGVAWKGCLTGPSGYIKFKYMGPSNERHLWYVYINGEVVGSIDQGDSFFNRVDVCAAGTLVTIEKLGVGRWENRYSIRPGTLTEIGVGDFLPLK